VCISYAKSIGVDQAGRFILSHFGVKTKILSLNKSIFKESINSLFHNFSVNSLSSRTQFISVAILDHFSLYSKCAATQILDLTSISKVLI